MKNLSFRLIFVVLNMNHSIRVK